MCRFQLLSKGEAGWTVTVPPKYKSTLSLIEEKEDEYAELEDDIRILPVGRNIYLAF